MDHPRPNLRYVDAKSLDDSAAKLRGLEVDSARNEALGKVEGFVIDVTTGRPYHVVVGSGGWFKHKHFLLPIGHVALSAGQDKLVADITKDRVERFPGFDKDLFRKLSEDDVKRLDAAMAVACCPDEVVAVEVWDATHYTYPTWWESDFYRPGRADEVAANVAGADDITSRMMTQDKTPTLPRERGLEREREQVVASAHAGETSPHFDGRAQPGDVLGVETGGERTYVGDTSDDENKRRRDAEQAAAKRKG